MYLTGFGNYHQSEAVAGALPQQQNSPQHCALGLYAEQLNGSAFTRARHYNLHSWLYRILPSATQKEYAPYSHSDSSKLAEMQPPSPMRWSPQPAPSAEQDFIGGLWRIAGNCVGHTYIYQCNRSMTRRFLHNRDGELLFVPYQGGVRLRTEFGLLEIYPGSIAVIPRGVFFQVELLNEWVAGYVMENCASPFVLPQLGPLGANGLANPRHFLYPQAAFEHRTEEVELFCKYQHHWWVTTSSHSPLNVVAWHGNYAPYCYDLSLFNTIGTVSFDHPDPSIFTLLTSESSIRGIANLDFVIFPPRWMVADHTFRPPYFHRNIMSELMGLIVGEYDAKKEGFEPGGISIHNCMSGHGPDASSYQAACVQSLEPEYYANTLAFMFESRKPWLITQAALESEARQKEYLSCWQELKSNFKTICSMNK